MISDRQLLVLRLMWDGLCTKEIARKIGVSPKTIEYHRVKLARKAKVSLFGPIALCRWGLRNGYLRL